MLHKIVLLLLFPLLLVGCKQPVEHEGLQICIGGDVMLDRGIRQQIERHGFTNLFRGLRDTFAVKDAVVVNLECPLTTVYAPVSKPFNFRGEPCWADSLHRMGITHACMANNHSYDQGLKGMTDTYQNLTDAHICPIGYGEKYEDRFQPAIVANGRDSIALFSVLFLSTGKYNNADNQPGICQANAIVLGQHIKEFKQHHPTTKVVVMPHWGIEYQPEACQLQRQQAKVLVEAGADLIAGHHPHVSQDCDTINGKFVYYSLGNLVFDQRSKRKSARLLYITLHNGKMEVRIDKVYK